MIVKRCVKFALRATGLILILFDGNIIQAHPASWANVGWLFFGLGLAIVGIELLEAGFK
jgi:hypothetical protein